MTVVVVTDASSRLPADLLEKWAIRVVPLHILLDGHDLRDGVDEIPDDVYKHHATTAAATPAELGAAYRAGVGRRRRGRRGGGAYFVGAVWHLRRGPTDRGRARARGAGHRLEIGGDGHRLCRAGRRAGRGGGR